MGYSVLLYFDEQTEQSILDLRHALTEYGIGSLTEKSGQRPHVSLVGFSNHIDYDLLVSVVREHAQDMKPFDVSFGSFGVFPSTKNVLFLSPIPTIELLTCHKDFHERLPQEKFVSSPYYLPDKWTPHCTLKMNIPKKQLANAVEYCGKNFMSIQGRFQEIGIIEYFPVKSLKTWRLAT